MARIRTIKPEFPQSESMGRVSREARLLFIMLWTLADDVGRLRGSSRMLASLLYPYDDDAPKLIDDWLDELDREGCLIRYTIERDTYIEICNWLIHQKIDKPSKSKIPGASEGSRILARVRESSSGDLRIKDQGSKDQGGDQGVSTTVVVETSRILASPRESTTKGRGKTAMPADFAISDRVRTWAAEHGFGQLDEHLDSFRSKCLANGYRYSNWDSAFMNAIRDDWGKIRERQGPGGRKLNAQEALEQSNAEIARAWASRQVPDDNTIEG